jgi:arylsulfatase A-like enzyme/HEAT repeat protein
MSEAVSGERGALNAREILRRGCLLGALAGAWIAFADFGAVWLWLPLWRDRLGLLLRLIGVLAPAGGLGGALIAALCLGAWKIAQRRQRPLLVFPLPFALLALVPLRVLAVRLCSGGTMSRLKMHGAVEWGLTLLLPVLLYAGLLLVLLGVERAKAHEGWRKLAAALLLGTGFALSKTNQTVLPNLYDYLHSGLAFVTWLIDLLGLWALCSLSRFQALRAGGERAGLVRALAVLLTGAFLGSFLTLNLNLNVRVAMFDARSPASRSLLSALDPVLRLVETRNGEKHAGKGLFRGAIDTTGLPTQDGAHVLLITIDALRADHLGTYGYERPTSPGLDALAKEATLFERTYAQAPHSSYSLSSLETSEYLHEIVELARPLPTETLATVFKAHGYHTAAFFTDGIFHTEGARLSQYRDQAFGFALFDHTNRESEDQTDRVLAEADRIKSLGEPPSFLWVHYFDVHEPYQETRFGTGNMDRYDSEIAHVDRELVRLLTELKKRFGREIIVAITADHGEEFREHGGVYHGSTLYDEQVRVPLILKAAALAPKRLTQPVEVIDVAPTLLGLAGIKAPQSMRGRDLRALAVGRVTDAGPVFSAVLTKRMALRWPFKLIADLRFNLFELYDLEKDPSERKNLANREPQKLDEMRGLAYAWLDSLEKPRGAASVEENAWSRALRWGRLGDRRAVVPMSELLLDRSAPTPMRVEAGQILAKLADSSCAPSLVKGMDTEPPEVAAEAAIALGRMYDERAREKLTHLVLTEDPYLRARAAVSLGRLRDRAAVPALIEALWVAPTQYEREEAVRWLGRLRDRRAVEPLLSIVPEFGLRYLVAVALGQIGDTRSYDALIDMLSWERHTNIRDEVVRGLGMLGDERATEALVNVLATEPDLKNTSESLVRLHALERGYLGGIDVAQASEGFRDCVAGPLIHDWDYLGRTVCTSSKASMKLKLPLPKAHARFERGAQLIIRTKRADSPEGVTVTITAGNDAPATLTVDGNFVERRIPVSASALGGAAVRVALSASDADARLTIDHVLLVPNAPEAVAKAAAPSGEAPPEAPPVQGVR